MLWSHVCLCVRERVWVCLNVEVRASTKKSWFLIRLKIFWLSNEWIEWICCWLMVLFFELKAQLDEFHQIKLVGIETSSERHGNDVFWIIAQQLARCKSTNSHSTKSLPLRDVFDMAEIVTYFKCLCHNYSWANFEWIFKRLFRLWHIILVVSFATNWMKTNWMVFGECEFSLATFGWNDGTHCVCVLGSLCDLSMELLMRSDEIWYFGLFTCGNDGFFLKSIVFYAHPIWNETTIQRWTFVLSSSPSPSSLKNQSLKMYLI